MWMRTVLYALVLTSGLVAAQSRTWIVDVNSGPNTDFTDLPPAIAAAIDGDTVLIRSGTYKGFTTSKALTVLGEAVAPGRVDWGPYRSRR